MDILLQCQEFCFYIPGCTIFNNFPENASNFIYYKDTRKSEKYQVSHLLYPPINIIITKQIFIHLYNIHFGYYFATLCLLYKIIILRKLNFQ